MLVYASNLDVWKYGRVETLAWPVLYIFRRKLLIQRSVRHAVRTVRRFIAGFKSEFAIVLRQALA